MRQMITKRSVDAMKPGEMISDIEVRGFIVRCLPSGVKTYSFRYRDKLSSRRRSNAIGLHGSITAEQARNLAKKRAGAVADHHDPLAERLAARAELLKADQLLFRVVADRFIERYAKAHNRRWQETERILKRYVLPHWGEKRIDRIGRLHVNELLDLLQDGKLRDRERPGRTLGGPVMADRVLAAIRKLFNWHAVRDEAFRSPIVPGMARTRSRERARDRILSDDEIRAFWKASVGESAYGPAVRFMLLSAQRPGEVLSLRRDDIDTDGVWTIDARSYKTKRTHHVPLSDAALAIVNAVPIHAGGEFVFTTIGNRPFSGDTKSKRRLDAGMLTELRAAALRAGRSQEAVAKLALARWTAHDLRRTARSLMSRAGVRPDIAERVLGHVIPGVAGVYDRHSYLPEKRDALRALANLVQGIVGGANDGQEIGERSPVDVAA